MSKGQIVQVQLCCYDDLCYQIAHVEYASGKIFHYRTYCFWDLPKTVLDFFTGNYSIRVSESNCYIVVSEGILTHVSTYRMRGCLSHE